MQTAALQAERTFVTGVEIRLTEGPVPGPSPQVTIQAQTGLADLEEPNRWRADPVSYTHLTLPTNREV